MIRIIATALVLASCAGLASAQDAGRLQALSGELRGEALARAETLSGAPGAPSAPVEPFDPFVTGVQDFAAEAMALSRHIEEVAPASDLKCIFRGMSEDALSRLDLLAEPARGADRARSYEAYARLFEDAEAIAADEDTVSLAALPCPASD
ncbi:hypothetical protein E5163_01765 [Marinicauda algicola]|uniref:Uncharacterized protein n=1 Tax=Marinicauda algicola TaxID=2029849 RepID=A0A4S2H3P7_9PROT|nr:hypothetical protein [Marinicauda algicola]TGY89892.1 hypothetical protein E5163_01765 [Marinicauda algicola]